MLLSLIICTYKRADALASLLDCLPAQTYRDFEVLIIDGSGEDSPIQARAGDFRRRAGENRGFRVVASPKGLTRQRNVGLGLARGDVIVFLDDDVTFGPEFLERAVEVLSRPANRETGGVTGFDCISRPARLNLRWRLRLWAGTIPSLRPGDVDRLGRSVPVGFLEPFSGSVRVGYLPGYCMIYRREAVANLRFDEALPTYGGEDRDFSMRVGNRWRLLLCGDLHLWHHRTPQSRDTGVQMTYQAGFGMARTMLKHARRRRDYGAVAHLLVSELIVDFLSFVLRPSSDRMRIPLARARGILDGVRSWQAVRGHV